MMITACKTSLATCGKDNVDHNNSSSNNNNNNSSLIIIKDMLNHYKR